MAYQTVIGLEVHAQLRTASKMFCGCSADYVDSLPNSHVCPVCLGMPGVLPTINRQAVEHAVMTALALNCTVSSSTKFDRKNYSYPDLMKGYQISQYDAPLSHHGWLEIETGGRNKRIGITRVHLEEDVAKLLHRTDASGETYSLVDVNRSGVPLMEIVSEPDMRSPDEAQAYLTKLHALLRYLSVSTGNMEDGSFRCDANISLRSTDGQRGFAKVEIKNMNSFKAVHAALKHEEGRQARVLQQGGQLVQETRGWDDDEGVTVSQRSKEHAHDYRYFPEPDLPPLTLDREWVSQIAERIPELPDAKRDRFVLQYGLSAYDAGLLTSSRALAEYFDSCAGLASPGQLAHGRAKAIANWMLGEFLRLLNVSGSGIDQPRVSPQQLASLLDMVDQGTISVSLAKPIFEEMFNTGKEAAWIVGEKGLTQISGAEEIGAVVEDVLRDSLDAVADYRNGKEKALQYLVGQVMKRTKGRAKPELAASLLKEKLR